MTAVYDRLVAEDRWWRYRELASAIHGDDPPTRSQLSSISRAVHQLHKQERVQVERAPGDRRATRLRLWGPLRAELGADEDHGS